MQTLIGRKEREKKEKKEKGKKKRKARRERGEKERETEREGVTYFFFSFRLLIVLQLVQKTTQSHILNFSRIGYISDYRYFSTVISGKEIKSVSHKGNQS